MIAHDIVAQCHSVFENVRLILEDAGFSLEDVVDVTTRLLGVGAAYAVGALLHLVFTGAASGGASRTFSATWWVAWAAVVAVLPEIGIE